jgi:hypothetical protein
MIEKYEPISDTDRIANVFDKFCRNVEGTKVNIMLVPTAFEVMSDKLPKYTATDEQSADMQKIFDGITAENAVKINPTSALESADKQIYYKLDHHWTSEGAYIGYRELCKSIGIKPSPLADFNKKVVTTDFYGTVYSKLNDYSVEGDTITAYSKDWNLTFKTEKTETDSIFNPEYLNKKDKYSYFLDNVHSYIEIENKDAKEEKSAVIIKDSYANCMIPFMIDDYSKIYIFDTRYYRENVSDFVNENHPTDVFVVYNMNTIGTDNGVNGIR